ncbi:transcriptional regulator [Moraxella caviae]|uniref:Arsenical resistance operon repressor n=2 Tax=Pseudomonadota TaxID=1224 RepID=A0A1T0ABR9_9GAMM|nr:MULTISPECIES: metalloregulator ArsR/SmtB family transcription factor [Pseudomonadota]OOR93175.1 transcriptional regulator [Moraxella caviae]QEY24136.1 ArsR family transcriptional regulator [Neisseria animalis]ROW31506.1 ArsR family transcriptional regulator [Neisseria animalis]STZ10443.1 Arsenical resistance operon repressor [Moraxella caviae]VEE06357.1 ArsR family transcriptional regulator [Neisseria animalis]
MPKTTIELLQEAVPVFSALADDNRLLILKILKDEGRLNVNALTEKLHLSRPAVSHHLKLMLAAGLVGVEQVGKERYYLVTLENAGRHFQHLMAAFIADGCLDSALPADV